MTNVARTLFFLLLLTLAAGGRMFYAAPMQQQQQPGPGKKLIQGPFGPIEVDQSDPRPAIAVGPPLQPAQTPAPAPAAPAQTPAAAPAAPAQGNEVIPVALHFNNAELHGVVDTIAGILQINYLVDPAVHGTVNLNSSGELRRSDLLPILETVLKMNGATMIKSGNFYQIVPANTALRNPIEVQRGQTAVASDDQIILQVVTMKFVSSEEMGKLLTPYLSEAGSVVAQGGILLVTDRRSNLRKLLDIVDVYDARAFEGERVRMFTIKYNKAKDVSDDLKSVFAGYALSTNTAIRFVPLEHMNSVLVVTPDPSVFTEVEHWLDKLDQPTQVAGLRNYIYRVKNAKASDIQRVLSDLYGVSGQTAAAAAAAAAAGRPAPAPTPAAPVPAAQETPPPPGVEPGLPASRLTGNVRIIADTINNQLVIQSTPQDYQMLQQTIEELDILPRQVLIDAQIYEVTLDHSLTFGLSAILQNNGTLPNQTTASFTSAAGLSASTFAIIGRSRQLISFLNASENSSKVRTLSAPSILVSNNATASMLVGAQVPVPTSSAASGAQQNGSTVFAQTISYTDTGVILDVTPQINSGGNVTMTISQEISEAEANTTSTISAPVIGKSSVKSVVVVKDGETIPITGFIKENDEVDKNRIPILGSIPVLGALLGETDRSKTRTELIVLITPHVITNSEEESAAADELKAKLKETQRLIN